MDSLQCQILTAYRFIPFLLYGLLVFGAFFLSSYLESRRYLSPAIWWILWFVTQTPSAISNRSEIFFSLNLDTRRPWKMKNKGRNKQTRFSHCKGLGSWANKFPPITFPHINFFSGDLSHGDDVLWKFFWKDMHFPKGILMRIYCSWKIQDWQHFSLQLMIFCLLT